ncbi:MAG: flagellar protein FlgN [Spirochaetota bacterium]
MNTLQNLHAIILREIDIYNNLLHYEEQKRGAIVAFNGDGLFSLSKEQEALLHELEKLENTRQKLVKNHAKNTLGSGVSTLKDFITSIKADDERIITDASLLKVKIEKFSRLHEANKKLIHDNIEFFNVVLSSLRKAATVETGYGPEGLSKRSASGSVLMNKTV